MANAIGIVYVQVNNDRSGGVCVMGPLSTKNMPLFSWIHAKHQTSSSGAWILLDIPRT